MNHRSFVGVILLLTIAGAAPAAFAQPSRITAHPGDNRNLPPTRTAPPVDVRNQPPRIVATPADDHDHHQGSVDPRVVKARQDRQNAMKDHNAWDANRSKRADEHRREAQTTYGSAASSPAGRAEMATHSDRMARLNRIADVANEKGDTALEARTQTAMSSEMTRHEQAMAAIQSQQGAAQ